MASMTLESIIYFFCFMTGIGAIVGMLWSFVFSFPRWNA